MNLSKAQKKLLLLRNSRALAFLATLGMLGGSCGILTAQPDSDEPTPLRPPMPPPPGFHPPFAPPPGFQPSPPKGDCPDDGKRPPGIPPSRPLRHEPGELPPEFEKNRERWEAMSPEERSFFRERAKEFRSEMKKQVEEALRSSGLQLEGEARREFAREYMRGRKEIEREIRDLMQKERESRISKLIEKLRTEFSGKACAASPIEKSSKEP